MKKKELVELRSKDMANLNKLIVEKRVVLIKTETDLAVGREKNLKKVKNLRYDIAQIKSVVREKGLSGMENKEVGETNK